MKKILALLIVLTLVVSTFASCDLPDLPDLPFFSNDTDEPADNDNQDNNNDVNDDTQNTLLEDAKNVLRDLYKEKLTTTAVDYSVVSQVIVDVDVLTVTWSVNNENIIIGEPDAETKTVLIQVPAQSIETIEYVLTATITAADGSSAQISFNATVPMFEVDSHADYMAAVKDDVLTIMGVVVAINSVTLGNKYNHLFLADTSVDGGYYCYKVSQDPEELGVKVGMTVSVTGKMSPYSGMQEIIEGQISILDTDIKTVDALDITNAFAAGADLGAYVGLPVSIKGVTIGAQDLEKDTSQYLYFAIGEEQGYVRTYITDFPTHMQADRDNIKATIDADHAAHFGYKADVEGILVLYSGNPYLIPMSVTPFTNYQEVEKTPAEKVAAEIGELKLNASFSADAVIDLLLKGKYYEDVTFTWATSDATNAAIADGKLTLTVPDNKTTVTITVTATCGDVTDTKEFTITLSKNATPIKDVVAIGAAKEHNTYTEEKYIVAGIITDIANTTYGNMTITDESGASIYVYGTYLSGQKYGEFTGDKPVVGDYVVISGIVGQYNGTPQVKNADITSFTTPTALKDAAATGAAKEHNTYTEEKFLVEGKVVEIANTTYGNLYIEDAEGNKLYIYGLYDQTNARFDKMANQPAVGDTITVLSVAGQYNGTAQLKNATLVCLVKGTTETPHEHVFVDGKCECGETDPNYQPPSGDDVMSIPEVLASAEGTAVVVKGTVSEIYQAWSDQYSNISFYIVDEAGNKLLVFRTGTLVGIGDQVTVTGTATLYKNVIQIAQGGVTVIDVAHVCSTFTEGSCTADTLCTVCGKVGTPAPGHNFVGGVCSACGEAEPQGEVIPENLTFTGAANKASADTYMKTNFPEWKITGKLGQTYGGYLGFGRSGDGTSAITSSAFSTTTGFTITTVLKGNGSSGVATSTLTFTLIDAAGNTIATGYAEGTTTAAIQPADAKDTTYNISFTFVEGKGWADATNLVVSFAKATGNIGLKSLTFVK